MKMRYKCICWATLLIGMVACTDEDYKLYDTGQKDSVFFEYKDANEEDATSVEYAFNYDIANEHTIEIPVTLMGMPSDHDRRIELAPVKEETDMVEGTHYEIEGNILPAHTVNATIKVKLLRDKDPELLEKAFKLKLEIVENDDLRSVGQRFFSITYSDIRPEVRPDWWLAGKYDYFPTYSYETAQLFFKYFYERAPKGNLSVFNQMIEAYGDYFVKAVAMQGPYAMYRTFLLRYVLIPMYEEDTEGKLEWTNIPTL